MEVRSPPKSSRRSKFGRRGGSSSKSLGRSRGGGGPDPAEAVLQFVGVASAEAAALQRFVLARSSALPREDGCDDRRNRVAVSCVRMNSLEDTLSLLHYALELDMDRAVDEDAFLRGPGLSNRMLSECAQMYGRHILVQVLRPSLEKMAVNRRSEGANVSLEIDPNKLLGCEDVAIRQGAIKRIASRILRRVYAIRDWPPAILRMCEALVGISEGVIPGWRDKALGALFFLRFICPAVTNPPAFGIICEALDPVLSRNLLLVAKLLLGVANQSPFEKETFMSCFEEFVTSQREPLDRFFGRVMEMASRVDGSDQESIAINASEHGVHAAVMCRAVVDLLRQDPKARDALPAFCEGVDFDGILAAMGPGVSPGSPPPLVATRTRFPKSPSLQAKSWLVGMKPQRKREPGGCLDFAQMVGKVRRPKAAKQDLPMDPPAQRTSGDGKPRGGGGVIRRASDPAGGYGTDDEERRARRTKARIGPRSRSHDNVADGGMHRDTVGRARLSPDAVRRPPRSSEGCDVTGYGGGGRGLGDDTRQRNDAKEKEREKEKEKEFSTDSTDMAGSESDESDSDIDSDRGRGSDDDSDGAEAGSLPDVGLCARRDLDHGDPWRWTAEDTARWLADNDLGQYETLFREKRLFGPRLVRCACARTLKELGVHHLGDRKRIARLMREQITMHVCHGDASSWSVEDVLWALHRHGLGRLAFAFASNEIDGREMVSLGASQLTLIGVATSDDLAAIRCLGRLSPCGAEARNRKHYTKWTEAEVAEWLASDVGLPDCAARFRSNAISGDVLEDITANDWGVLGLTGVKTRIRFRRALRTLQAHSRDGGAFGGTDSSPVGPPRVTS